MKKKYFSIALLAALMFAGCAENDESQQPSSRSEAAIPGQTPVGFSAYANRSTTRSGLPGTMNLDSLQLAEEKGGGFGVFAYYTDLKNYDQTYIPNFMYNQGVFYNEATGNWEYSPLLYWPNEYGSDANSDDEDKVTFFAYAPYVPVTSPASGNVEDATYGITGFSRNTTAGDPLVKYIASFDPAKSVDLCWGVVGSDDTNWGVLQGSTASAKPAGLPWTNVEHPAAIDQKLKFTFKHALAQLNVQIDADPDVTVHSDEADIKEKDLTKVYVRSISFTGVALQGALNLNNTKADEATWLDYGGTTDLPYGQSVTVKDGRRDGREGTNGAEANNETPQGLNKLLVQSTEWGADDATPGVTGTAQNLFQPTTELTDPDDADQVKARLEEPVCVIPTGEAMTVTIVYDIETKSDNVSTFLSDGKTHGVSIENRISKTITLSNNAEMSLVSGKRYIIKLHLGMNSVKFDATVSNDWKTTVNGTGWLPGQTGEGQYNPKNPMTITKLNAETVDLEGPQATKATIYSLQHQGAENLMNMESKNASDWTSSNGAVVQIAEDASAARSFFRSMTRAGSGDEWTTALSDVSKIKIKPVGAGTAIITATDHDGNTSKCAITVVAPKIEIDKSSVTLYKFATATTADNDTVTATIVKADDPSIDATDKLKEVKVETTANPAEPANLTITVATATLSSETGEIALVPKNLGTAKVTVSTDSLVTKSFTVEVKTPTLKASTSALTAFLGKTKSLTYTATPAEDEDGKVKVTATIFKKNETDYGTTHDESVITYDKETGTVTPVAVGTAKIVFQYNGHTVETGDTPDPKAECVVTVLEADPTTMKVGENVMKQNPLWQVTQYNVAKPEFWESDDDASDAKAGMPKASSFKFMTYHSTTASWVFSHQCVTDTINALACKKDDGDTSNNGVFAGYHVPTVAEQRAIVPGDKTNTASTNIFSLGTNDAYFTFPTTGTAQEGSGTSYFMRKAANDYYAVRIFGEGDDAVATAWHYKRAANAQGVMGFTIEAYVLKKEASAITSLDDAKVILGALSDAEAWSAAKNLSPVDTEGADLTSDDTSLVSRFMPACGYRTGSGVAASGVGTNGTYWSETAGSGSKAFDWALLNGRMYEGFDAQTYGFSVRLFRDN